MKKLLHLFAVLMMLSAFAEIPFFLSLPVDGEIILPFGENSSGSPLFHRGIDIACPPGTTVTAPLSGKITFAGYTPAGSGTVTVKSSNGYKITILQLQRYFVKAGDIVTTGQPVALSAKSGDRSSIEPHIHLSIRNSSGEYLNPADLLAKPEHSTVSAGETETNQTPAVVEKTGRPETYKSGFKQEVQVKQKTEKQCVSGNDAAKPVTIDKKVNFSRKISRTCLERIKEVSCAQNEKIYFLSSRNYEFSRYGESLALTLFALSLLSVISLAGIMHRQSLLPSFARGP